MSAREDLISHFYYQDPFEGFSYTEDDVDYTGLSPDHPVFESALSFLQPSVIVEVGSWKGKSAITMAKILHRRHIDGVIVCVDTWLGSPEHCLSPARHPTRPEHYESLRHKNGLPRLYQTFMANVAEQGMTDYIIPLPNTSDNAFEMFRKIGLTTDFVYIDAAHEYESAMRDIVNSWNSLRNGGILVLDDYLKWPGVTKAVDDFAADVDAKVYGEYLKAAIGKGMDIGAIWVPALPR
jgi:predicted O-methyltransferase YrrM